MFRKLAIIAALVASVGLVAFAGFDQYTSKNYTTLIKPTTIGVTYFADGATTQTVAIVSNSNANVVNCSGLVGRGALVMNMNPGNGGNAGVISVMFETCATTNGTYVTLTNADGVSSWAVTTTAAVVVAPIVPNSQSKFWRCKATATAVTNGSFSAILVTE